MIPRRSLVLMLALVLTAMLALSVSAKVGLKADRVDAGRADKVQAFAVGPYAPEQRAAYSDLDSPAEHDGSAGRAPRPVGTAQSPNAGLGIGESVDQTWDDAQWNWGKGRQVASYSNGSDIVDVHFAYRDDPDTLPSTDPGWGGYAKSAYNVYSAVDNDWPRGQNAGCELQSVDTLGYGYMPSMDLLEDGRVVLAADNFLYGDTLIDGTDFVDNMFFFQAGQYGCYYTTQPSFTNVTNIDSLTYQPYWQDATNGNISRDPQVVTQWDGSQTITHVLLGENNFIALSGPAFVDGETYHVITYFRGVGSSAATHVWQPAESQLIDTTFFPWYTLAAAPYPHQGVAVCWTNPTVWGGQLNQADDNDIWYRESTDRGLNWGGQQNATNFQNAIADDPAHFTAWLEVHGLYTTDGNLHFIFPARPTSADPYFDGYNWSDFDESLYHWDKTSNRMVKIANGVFYNDDMLSGSPNTFHCGFGSLNAGYLGWSQLAECDGKLYAIWAQIHERLNMATTDDWAAPENEHLIDDCSLAGERLAKANWEIMMSVADMASPTLWDPARNITNTYTPNCCLPGDTDPDCEGACGSEWKPMLEKYGLDYSGLGLTWPDNYVDMTPTGDPAYTGGYFLNLAYLDDQYPGPALWGDRTNPPATDNSIKWVRLACVEPVEASLIRVGPRSIDFPEWARTGQTTTWEVTVTNEGNVQLNVSEIGVDETTGSGWLGVSASTMAVAAGLNNTGTFDIEIDASAITVPTWLEGEVYLKSDAQNFDSVSVHLHILAAPHVEPAVWDTVFTHADMYDPYGLPVGDCIGLAVSNMGEVGWGSATGVNLDFEWSGNECGTRDRDHMYLATASPFVLDADGSGANVMGTASSSDIVQTDADGWDPFDNAATPTVGADLAESFGPGGIYQEVYAGKSVNRDTTIVWERWFYGPRDNTDENSFVGVINKVYTADGLAHNNLTLGMVADWDVPAEDVPNNVSGVSTSGNFTYMQGTDTTGVLSCQLNNTRFGAEAFGAWTDDPCAETPVWTTDPYGQASFFQMLMEDTNLTRLGATLDPRTPDYQAWWDDIVANPGFNGYSTAEDQAIWTTYVHNHNLAGDDTLYIWSIFSTVRSGSLTDLESQVAYARTWFTTNVLPNTNAINCGGGGCCQGRVGDANNSGDDEPTIGDISAIISALFIIGDVTPIQACLPEADVNQSGLLNPTYDDITIGDISLLIAYLFINGPYDPVNNPSGTILPNCL